MPYPYSPEEQRELRFIEAVDTTTYFRPAKDSALKMLEEHPELASCSASRDDKTPLHILCGHTGAYTFPENVMEVAKALVEKNPGAIESHDEKGFTPLHMTVISEKRDLFRFLISKGANPYARTNTGLTALELARKYASSDMVLEIERALLKHETRWPKLALSLLAGRTCLLWASEKSISKEAVDINEDRLNAAFQEILSMLYSR